MQVRWWLWTGLVAACSDPEPETPMRSPACVAQDDKMELFLADDWMAPNPMVTVKNAECGNTVYIANPENGVSEASLWRVGSLTKTFVSTAILSLAKDGLLTLDDPLERYVPNVANTTGVTLGMLLGHRSGIFNYTEDPVFLMQRDQPWTPRQIVDFAASHPPVSAPGSFYYSNTNYILLGMVIEAVTGRPVVAVLHERAIDRAALVHTFFDGGEPVPEMIVPGYGLNYVDITNEWNQSALWTAGSMVASPTDMTDWVSTLYGTDTVLDPTRRALLVATPAQHALGSYGLGVEIRYVKNAGNGFGHSGGLHGYYTHTMYFPDRDTAVAVGLNRDGGNIDQLFNAALAVLFP